MLRERVEYTQEVDVGLIANDSRNDGRARMVDSVREYLKEKHGGGGRIARNVDPARAV